MNNRIPVTPPCSVESEQALLGGLLLDNDAIDRVNGLQASDFYEGRHQAVYGAMMDFARNGDSFDPVLVAERLERDNGAQGGATAWLPYLGSLARETPGSSAVESHARVIRHYAWLRRVMVGTAAVQQAAMCNLPLGKRVAEVERELMRFADVESECGFRPIKSVLGCAVDEIEARYMGSDGPRGVQTGIAELDDIVVGLEPGDLVVLAGRPSMGKTAFALHIAHQCALNGGTVGLFSLEMSDTQLVTRLLSARSGVPLTTFRRGDFENDHWPKVTAAINELAELGIEIDDSSAVTVGEIAVRARRLARRHPGLSMLVIDYLQLIETSGRGNGAELIGQITRALKATAKELGLPVVLLSQLNRELERRSVSDRRPMPADLRGSGDIEQDADLILFLYRDVVYNPDTPDPDVCEIIVGKHRNGPLGTARCRFVEELAWFDLLPHYDPYDPGFGVDDHDYGQSGNARAAQAAIIPELD